MDMTEFFQAFVFGGAFFTFLANLVFIWRIMSQKTVGLGFCVLLGRVGMVEIVPLGVILVYVFYRYVLTGHGMSVAPTSPVLYLLSISAFFLAYVGLLLPALCGYIIAKIYNSDESDEGDEQPPTCTQEEPID